MRTGAIFPRGRALKWMARFGVVFVLGAGPAAAQVTVTTPATVDEGGRLTIGVSAKISVARSFVLDDGLTVRATVASKGDDVTTAQKALGLSPAEVPEDMPASVDFRLPVAAHPGGGVTDPVDRELEGEFIIQTNSDFDAESEIVVITYSFPRGYPAFTNQGGGALSFSDDSSPKDVIITDTDTQTFAWKGDTTTAKEGTAINISLEADPQPQDLTYDVAFSVDASAYALGITAHEFTKDAPTANISVTSPTDGNREPDTITLRAIMAGTNDDLVDPLPVEVADIHALPDAGAITAEAFTVDDDGDKTEDEAASVMEGGDPVVVTVTVDRGDGDPQGEKLKVAVSARDGSQRLDYRVSPATLTIAEGEGEQPADFTLWALADDDVGAEDLVLSLVVTGENTDNGSGEVSNTFSIAIVDDTTRLVSAKDGAYDAIMAAMGDDPLTPGSVVELMTDDLFEYGDMVNVSIAASVDGSAVSAAASGDVVTLTAASAGEAKVTVTATATPRSGSLTVTQDRANVVQLTFPVTVELEALSISLVGPDDVNLVEGMSYAITAEANRAVTEDTVVELFQTAGTASPADYEVDSITIASGESSGSAMLMVVDDGESDSGTGSPETLTLEGRVGSMKTNALTLHLWDAAVPALPLVAQLLLAALLGLGGYRRYRRR